MRAVDITTTPMTEDRLQDLGEMMGEMEGAQAVGSSCPHHCLLLHTCSRFWGKKGNGQNYRLNIFFWWTRSSWMDLRFPTSYSTFTDIQNTNRKPSSSLLLLLPLFTALRIKHEWRQNYSLKVKNGYFSS